MKPEGGFGGASFAPPAARVTQAIVALCVVVEAAVSVRPRFGDALLAHAALVPARLTGSLLPHSGDLPAVLTLLTALFLHAGWLHLVVNMTFLLWVGRHVELVAGRAYFGAIYVVSGLAGGLLEVAVAPHSPAQIIGASGAIAGVFGAYAVLFARSRIGSKRLFGLTIAGEVFTAAWYLATWVGLQLLIAVAFNTGAGGIAVWTHIGGFIIGLIGVQPLARRLRRTGV